MPGPGMEYIGEEERSEVLDVINSGYLFRYGDSSNPSFKAKVWTLEKEFSEYAGSKYALAVTSGTVALLTALQGLGIGPGDEVIVPGYSFVASMSAIIYSRAIPVLAEIDETLNLSAADIEKRISPRTKAIMAVHMLGNACRMDEIMKVAEKYSIPVIEDTAQACGGSYKGRKLGSIGRVGAYSFNIYKTMTSGDGGMVVTSNEEIYNRCFAFHDQGHTPNRQGVEIGNRSMLGLDFRMNELTGAVALAQLRKLEAVLQHLREIKKVFKNGIAELKNIKFRELPDPEGECATLLTIILPTREIAETVGERLGAKVLLNSGWHVYRNMEQLLLKKTSDSKSCPFNCPYYGSDVKYEKGMLPQTEDILSRSLNLSVGLRDKGIGAAWGLGPRDTVNDAEQKAEEFKKLTGDLLK
ncbi:MAG: DegT/DnrJ/EryC1/StrS family aminotransferase [Victivallaceae bacterium]